MQKDFISAPRLMTATKDTGFIYILENPSYPDCVKIGKTTRLPGSRAAELSSGTAVPTPFSVVYCRLVDNLSNVENVVHKSLWKYRRNNDREFFDLNVPDAQKHVNKAIDDYYGTEYNKTVYRKKQDAKWAMVWDRIKVPFEYIENPIKVGDWMHFTPDFWLPNHDCYVVISQGLFGSDAGRMIAYCFAQKFKKVIVQLYNCKPGIEYDGKDMIFHSGFYIAPEGDYDGTIEFGICSNCGTVHLGHQGTAVLCDSPCWSPVQNDCDCLVSEPNPELELAYKLVNDLFK
ncbi:MAG: GIY-YIG nuclease family protein [Desulfobacula sp.]|uniref:GIY-YIG nuclease family protein n=1 Tax=Desulfobacula sp. TaxID=2593537 RepID=UPI001E189CB2|nr:GIY-YIG nuclease family protein [Desulfobacula sp.]MBT4509223.1 GIY-YIG nuclease family protein [Desulfobacula sp.]MBT6338187.1 GIY-YIG nuclease family protein [Desulfobacula sp.]